MGRLNILEQATIYTSNGNWKAAMELVTINWDNYDEIIKPYENELMDLFEMCSLDCCFEIDFE